MRAKAIEIRWHSTKPIYSTDFQRTPPSNLDELLQNKSHPYTKSEQEKLTEKYEEENGYGKVWRLATAGGDNMVMMWLVYPKPTAAQVKTYRNVHQLSGPIPTESNSKSTTDIKNTNEPIVEYLATLAKHQGVVNVVRFSPKGEILASAGDDGNVLLWVLSANRGTTTMFGESAADKIYDRESWRTRLMLRGPAQCEIYDVAWSPCGDFLLTGDTAKTARIWNVTDGLCIKQITEHSNFVQGVAWDPLGKYIATQSSDRSMNIYSLQINREESGSATAEVHYVGKNHRIELLNQQINSWASYHNQPQAERCDTGKGPARAQAASALPNNLATSSGSKPASSSASNTSASRPQLGSRTISTATTVSDHSSSVHPANSATPAISVPQTPSSASGVQTGEESFMQPPAEIPHHSSTNSLHQHQVRNHSRSRQSSIVSSQTVSPASMRPIRSPSPVPPLPAIHVDEGQRTKSVLLYGDEGASAFFRRLTWSVDGSMLLTPAGRWESQFSLEPGKVNSKGKEKEDSRNSSNGTKKKRKKKDYLGIDSTDEDALQGEDAPKEDATPTVFIYGRGSISSGNSKAHGVYPPIARLPGHKTNSVSIRFSPVIYELNPIKVEQQASPSKTSAQPPKIDLGQAVSMEEVSLGPASEPKATNTDSLDCSSAKQNEGSSPPSSGTPTGVFDLRYRMVYAVATHDSVFVYDTQQSSPICMFGNLHFSSFTDLSWTADGEGLILSSSDGYCSLVSFDPNELGKPLSEDALKKLPVHQTLQTLQDKLSTTTQTQPQTQIKEQKIKKVISSNDNLPQKAVVTNLSPKKVEGLAENKVEKLNDKGETEAKSGKVTRPAPENEGDLLEVVPKKKRATLTYEGPVQR